MQHPQTQTEKPTHESQPPHVAILASPGMGHLIPLIEFAKRLVVHHNLTVTFVIPTTGPPSKAQNTVLQSLPNSINHIFLPPVSLNNLSGDAQMETIICNTLLRSLPSLRHALQSLTSTKRLVALVVDLFGTDAFDVAKEFNVSRYVFFPTTAMTLSFILYLPKLDEEVDCEFRDLPKPINIPGSVPVQAKDLMDPAQNRKREAYKWVIHLGKRYSLAEGVFVNSFAQLEPETIEFLLKKEPGKPLVYPVGPLVNTDSINNEVDVSECLKWLDDQSHDSVLFVCFGSGGTLSSDQINELALGLETSEQRFLWVVRSPNDKVVNASYFSAQSQEDPLEFLPQGFVERTKGRGIVVPSWAPQAQILSHSSTGGFLTHCGWNSILESVVNGVPLIAWPLYAEQKMNAVMLTQDIEVALRPNANENGLVERGEIAKIVKDLMEGDEGKKIRYRMKDLKEAAARVLSENGSSTKVISEFALKLKNKNM
ncbi:Glycosyltransferase [Quillaja saponaria]|uniref:Glycosyltransferase n=1 Tax=Quillaja saponaria TaxID=32244 RepID=A0AAD7L4B2_QUISA|nr:Glycosyltransferase [Quillaja saponaria]